MHILLTNDDGPPSDQSSPYVLSFVRALQKAGHLVSVILPNQQRSWIGKAHFVSQIVHTQTYISPDADDQWILLDASPATCTQIGLFHCFRDRPKIDLVVSGPNYGRNCTALFSLSSGTVGGAMEAATFGKRAIALSFAFWSRVHDDAMIGAASRRSVAIVEYLATNWATDADLYSVNVPLVSEVETARMFFTDLLSNTWASGSSFEEISTVDQQTQRSFRWAPKFADVQKSIDAAAEGNDGWAVANGHISITALKANFETASQTARGELLSSTTSSPLFVLVAGDEYLLPILQHALNILARHRPLKYSESISDLPSQASPVLQLLPYEAIDFEHVLQHPTTSLANAYVIRKALIRKTFLWNTVHTWNVKHENDPRLRDHVPVTVNFELDYAEFLDEALVDCWDLQESFARQEDEWWILKPSMSDQGHGVRLFNTESSLRAIFEDWEEASDGEDEQGVTSQLRHFCAQRYLERPLLLPQFQLRKFHIRTYVLAVGALSVYVFQDMLALFSGLPYQAPSAENAAHFKVHLTNSCLQGEEARQESVALLDDLNDEDGWKDRARSQIDATTAAIFEAASREQMVHFQTLPNAFEVFGVDWLVDHKGQVWLLEINACPDFKQCGPRLSETVQDFWQCALELVTSSFFAQGIELDQRLKKVLDIELRRS